MEKSMNIYGVPLSVHTRKVIVAARLKGVPSDVQVVVPVAPDGTPPNWRDLSPTGLIPAIEEDGFRLADSTAIIHYMEQKYPRPPLLPTDAKELGEALFLDAWAGSELFRKIVHPLFHNQIVNPKIRNIPSDGKAIDTAMHESAPAAFGYLESLQPANFLVGSSLTIADLAVVSNLVVFHYLGHSIGDRFPKLNAYFRRHIESSPLRAVLGEEAPFVEQMGLDRSFLH
jgi:glutathione S-transferase